MLKDAGDDDVKMLPYCDLCEQHIAYCARQDMDRYENISSAQQTLST